MTSKPYPLLQDPGYDSVREICASLGYKSDTKTERHFKILSTKTANHRKKFVEKFPTLIDFPLSNVAPEVQTCAVEFLDQYWHLFQDSNEARAFSWPIYPFDRSRILSGVAKLMCAQEYLRQKNMNTRAKAAEGDIQSQHHASVNQESDDDAPLIVGPRSPCSVPNFADQGTSAQDLASMFGGPTDSESDSENEEDAEEMKKNIDIHLDYVYPLNHSRDGKASGWLFTSEKCPDDVEPFAFRYLHEHNLYNSKADNIDAIHKFSKSLKLHLDITCAPSKDHKIFKRCEQLVQRASRKWDAGGYGFLTKRNGGIRKTPVFEHAWMHHRKRWIEEIHFGDTAGLLEIPSQCPSPPTIPTQAPPIANNKRQADGVESTGDSRQRTEAGPSKRRSNESSATPKAHSAGPSMPPMPPAQAGFTQPSSNRSVTRAPEAIMVTPFPVELTPEPIQSATSGPSSIATASGLSQSTNHPNRFSDFIFDDLAGREPSVSASVVSSGLAGSNYDAPYLVDSPPPLKTEPPSPGLDGVAAFAKLLSTQARSPSIMHSVSQCGSAAADGPAPEKPKLYFAIENSKGMPDTSTSQLVSGPTFRDSSLSDFFALVATRSQRAIDSLDEITLRYTWINQNAVVVNKDIGDEAWEDIKEDVVDFFRMSREDNSARRRFHIWVMAGDITKAGKSTSRDDI